MAGATETLEAARRDAGALSGSSATYAFSADLRITKYFDGDGPPFEDRGEVSVGFAPYTTSAEMNLTDFGTVVDLIRRAIAFAEAQQTHAAEKPSSSSG